jgi:hypothetical protein
MVAVTLCPRTIGVIDLLGDVSFCVESNVSKHTCSIGPVSTCKWLQ